MSGIADHPAKRIGADLLLEDGAHPLERGLTGLLAFVRLEWGHHARDRVAHNSAAAGLGATSTSAALCKIAGAPSSARRRGT
jgi:hypothetical protein